MDTVSLAVLPVRQIAGRNGRRPSSSELSTARIFARVSVSRIGVEQRVGVPGRGGRRRHGEQHRLRRLGHRRLVAEGERGVGRADGDGLVPLVDDEAGPAAVRSGAVRPVHDQRQGAAGDVRAGAARPVVRRPAAARPRAPAPRAPNACAVEPQRAPAAEVRPHPGELLQRLARHVRVTDERGRRGERGREVVRCQARQEQEVAAEDRLRRLVAAAAAARRDRVGLAAPARRRPAGRRSSCWTPVASRGERRWHRRHRPGRRRRRRRRPPAGARRRSAASCAGGRRAVGRAGSPRPGPGSSAAAALASWLERRLRARGGLGRRVRCDAGATGVRREDEVRRRERTGDRKQPADRRGRARPRRQGSRRAAVVAVDHLRAGRGAGRGEHAPVELAVAVAGRLGAGERDEVERPQSERVQPRRRVRLPSGKRTRQPIAAGGPSRVPTQSSSDRLGGRAGGRRAPGVGGRSTGGVEGDGQPLRERRAARAAYRVTSGGGGRTPWAIASRLAAPAAGLPRTAWKTDSAVSTSARASTASSSASSAAWKLAAAWPSGSAVASAALCCRRTAGPGWFQACRSASPSTTLPAATSSVGPSPAGGLAGDEREVPRAAGAISSSSSRVVQVALETLPEQRGERLALAGAVEQAERGADAGRAEVDVVRRPGAAAAEVAVAEDRGGAGLRRRGGVHVAARRRGRCRAGRMFSAQPNPPRWQPAGAAVPQRPEARRSRPR